MYIGQIGIHSYLGKRVLKHSEPQSFASVELKKIVSRQDRLTINSRSKENEIVTGIYRPDHRTIQSIGLFAYTHAAPDKQMQAEILPASEQTSYTEKDALLNQYMKQYRISGDIEGDTFARNSAEPVRLALVSQVSETELERFRQDLNENGLDPEIDWQGVKSDFWHISVGFDNIERLETKADYLASRYAVLKDRIQNQFTGDRQILEMQKLDQIYSGAREEMAESYADNIGKFYEGLSQPGAASDMKNSVLAMVDEKAAAYEDYLVGKNIYAEFNNSSEQWLKQDDAYMAARLREKFSVFEAQVEGQKAEKREFMEQAPYSLKDLVFAGAYAKSLSGQLKRPELVWNTAQPDSDLGAFLADQNIYTQKMIANADISDKLSDMLYTVFEPFMEKFIDALDHVIDEQKTMVNKRPWMRGLVREGCIDRNHVYAFYQYSLINR